MSAIGDDTDAPPALGSDSRDRRADERDRRAEERDRQADERDRRADERDAVADDRRLLADDRERLLDERQQELTDRADRDEADARVNAEQARRLRAIREGLDRRITVVELQEWLLSQPPEGPSPDAASTR